MAIQISKLWFSINFKTISSKVLGLGGAISSRGFFGRMVHAKDGFKMGGDAIFTGNGPINNVSNTTLSTKVTGNIFG